MTGRGGLGGHGEAGGDQVSGTMVSRLTSLYARRMGVTMKKRMNMKKIMSASC